MADAKLFLTVPAGLITATSLDVEGLARHRSPGSGKHFHGRKIYVELSLSNGRPNFSYLDEGGWRDAMGDTDAALASVATGGKRTKTALSNNAFSCTPLDAYRLCHLVKTGGEVMALEPGGDLHRFPSADCREEMSPADVAEAVGLPEPRRRTPRLYLVISPIQLVLLSNLTPEEYAWYATHRPGKVFRQVLFAEIGAEPKQLAAHSRFADARLQLEKDPTKKTKTVVAEDCMGQVPFHTWIGYRDRDRGGLYMADRARISVWRFPAELPLAWERAAG